MSFPFRSPQTTQWLSGKESTCQCKRFRRQGNGNLLRYPCLGDPMDRGAWWATVHGIATSLTRLSTRAQDPSVEIYHWVETPGISTHELSTLCLVSIVYVDQSECVILNTLRMFPTTRTVLGTCRFSLRPGPPCWVVSWLHLTDEDQVREVKCLAKVPQLVSSRGSIWTQGSRTLKPCKSAMLLFRH